MTEYTALVLDIGRGLTYSPTSDILRLMLYSLDIRPKRQVTLPRGLLESLDLEVGDAIEIKVQGKKAQITSKKQAALDALREIQRIVKESGISEEEMQESARKIRQELNEKRAA